MGNSALEEEKRRFRKLLEDKMTKREFPVSEHLKEMEKSGPDTEALLERMTEADRRNSELEDKIGDLEKQIAALHAKDKEPKSDDFSARIQQLETTIETLLEKETKMKKYSNDLQNKIAVLENDKSELKAGIERVELRLHDQSQLRNELTREKSTLQSRLTTLENENSELKLSISSVKPKACDHSRFEKKIQGLESELAPLREKVKTWEVLIEELQRQLETRNTAIEDISNQATRGSEELKKQIESLEQELTELRHSKLALQEELTGLKDLHHINDVLLQEKAVFEKKITELNLFLQAKENEKAFETENARRLANLVTKLREQVETLRASSEQMNAELKRTRQESENRIRALEMEKQRLMENLTGAQSELSETQSQLKEKLRTIAYLTESMESLTQENILLDKEGTDLMRERDELLRQKSEFEAELARLKGALQRNEEVKSIALRESEKLRTDVENLRAASTELSAADKQLIDDLQKKMEENLARIESLESEKEYLNVQVSTERKKIEEVQARLVEKENAITDLSSKIERAKSEIAGLQQSISALQTEKLELERHKSEFELRIRDLDATAMMMEERRQSEQKSQENIERVSVSAGKYTQDVELMQRDIQQQLEMTLLDNAKKIKRLQEEIEVTKKQKENEVQNQIIHETEVANTEEMTVTEAASEQKDKKSSDKRTHRRVLAAKATATAYRQSALGLLKLSPNFVVELRDISVAGASLFVTQKLQPHDKIVIQILDNSFKERLRLSGEVVWCRFYKNDIYACGVRFVKPATKDVELLSAFVKYYSDPTVIARLQSTTN